MKTFSGVAGAAIWNHLLMPASWRADSMAFRKAKIAPTAMHNVGSLEATGKEKIIYYIFPNWMVFNDHKIIKNVPSVGIADDFSILTRKSTGISLNPGG